MPKKRPKYFPNNWKSYKESPDDFFIPLTYSDFFNWKVMGWALPSSVACVIREEKDGKISEKIYSQSQSARKYLQKEMSNKDASTIFTVADNEAVMVYYPKGKKGYVPLPKDIDPEYWDELTDEEIDDLFG